MAKQRAAQTKNGADVILLHENEKCIIKDVEAGSKGMAPVQLAAGTTAEVVKVDKGLIKKIPEGKFICDSLVYGLCRKLQALSIQRKLIKNMSSLLFYIQPDMRVKNMEVRGLHAPYIIRCYNNNGGAILYPDALLGLL